MRERYEQRLIAEYNATEFGRLQGELAAARAVIAAVRDNATSWHGDDAAKGRALNVIAGWCAAVLDPHPPQPRKPSRVVIDGLTWCAVCHRAVDRGWEHDPDCPIRLTDGFFSERTTPVAVQPNLSAGQLSADGTCVTAHNSVNSYTFPVKDES